MKYVTPKWKDIYLFVMEIAERVEKDGFNPDIIVGIGRGGWVPARLLSDILDNPNLANLRVEFYKDIGKTMEKPVITQPVSLDVRGKKVLAVDDVADTGNSLRLAANYLRGQGAAEIRVATLHVKPWSKFVPDYHIVNTEAWIVYPWELGEIVRNITRRLREGGEEPGQIRKELDKTKISPPLVEYFLKRFSKDDKEEEAPP